MTNCKIGKQYKFLHILYINDINMFEIYFTNAFHFSITKEKAAEIIKTFDLVYEQANNYDWGRYKLKI